MAMVKKVFSQIYVVPNKKTIVIVCGTCGWGKSFVELDEIIFMKCYSGLLQVDELKVQAFPQEHMGNEQVE